MSFKSISVSLILFFFPTRFVYRIVNLVGCEVSSSAKIGFSLVMVNDLKLASNSRIGHFNFISTIELRLSSKAYIGRKNFINGPIKVVIEESGSIGNDNVVSRAKLGVTYGESILKIGVLSKITASHRIDCTRSITIGNYTTIAGANSQIWTHGYVHDESGKGRFRVDGEIKINNNVYIGSMCVINAGLTIGNGITVGSASCVSKSLSSPGLYVSQPLRVIDLNRDLMKSRLNKVSEEDLLEEVYEKKAK